ncbi:MAG TPA: BACON domain-containing carbohydrate-binding protein [Bryobacteraceae bacterium]|jgi:uncharacterized protein (TIGR03437 family)|nr:BACON domain-containing carbohydrate-binding protein [Bryobacteraceae bacterium]
MIVASQLNLMKILNRAGIRYLTYCAAVCACALQLGSQSTGATVVLTSIPAWGQDGQITGYIYGLPSDKVALYLFEFIPDVGWGSISGCGTTSVQSTGQFSVNATPELLNRNATRISAYLVPSSLTGTIPCVGGAASIPFVIAHNALSFVSYPRIPAYSTLSFGGLDWFIKSAPVEVSPYNQYFTNDTAFVDQQGQLHLKVEKCSGSWCAAEIFTKQTVGYGSYSFSIASQLNNLDPNLTLGLFTWDGQAGDQNNREWDIEFARWGNLTNTSNAQYVVQPYNGPNNLTRFLMSPAANSTHVVQWSASQMNFSSSASNLPIASWNYVANAFSSIPTPGDVHLHLNLYIGAGTSPASQVGTEIIISNFHYTPAAASIGLPRNSDSIPFYSSTTSVQVPGTAGCSASVESDSPWLSIAGSNSFFAGGSFVYSVSDNYGGPRSGNIILTSNSCNPGLNAQVLTVSQAGLVCSPGFAKSSTQIGFVQTVRSIAILGTAPVCTWSVSTSAPWLHITSNPAGAGDGSVTFSADANGGAALRQGGLVLNNGNQHLVLQDASSASFALSPSVATPCGNQQTQFGASWVTQSPGAEIHLNSPTGTLVGQFGPAGSTLLPQVPDGTLIYLVQSQVTSAGSSVLGSAMVSILPADCTASTIAALGVVNAAGYSKISVAPGSFVSVFGTNLTTETANATAIPYPTSLANITVSVAGELCALTYASPSQINFIIPSDIVPGRYLLKAGTASTEINVTNVSPGFFTLAGNGTGVPLSQIYEVLADGSSTEFAPYQCDSACHATPITIPDNLTDLYLVLYGTGLRNLKGAMAQLGPLPADVVYVGAVAQYPGLDQINLHLKNPAPLSGTQTLSITADGVAANSVSLQFQ